MWQELAEDISSRESRVGAEGLDPAGPSRAPGLPVVPAAPTSSCSWGGHWPHGNCKR